jgi:hypothetical protein
MPGVPLEFPVTRWSLVLDVRGDPARSREALETLLRLYWPPLYAFLPADGQTPENARVLDARRRRAARRTDPRPRRARPVLRCGGNAVNRSTDQPGVFASVHQGIPGAPRVGGNLGGSPPPLRRRTGPGRRPNTRTCAARVRVLTRRRCG